jgi:hypothetical protein
VAEGSNGVLEKKVAEGSKSVLVEKKVAEGSKCVLVEKKVAEGSKGVLVQMKQTVESVDTKEVVWMDESIGDEADR